jgi:hypothetical protein
VQRRQNDALLYRLDHRIVHENGLRVLLTAVDNPMAYRRYLVQAAQNAGLRVGQEVQDHLYGVSVIGNGALANRVAAALAGMLYVGALDPYPLDKPLSEHRLVLHVEQLILQRRTATIQHEDFHSVTHINTCLLDLV